MHELYKNQVRATDSSWILDEKQFPPIAENARDRNEEQGLIDTALPLCDRARTEGKL
jgi:hypothetical protein